MHLRLKFYIHVTQCSHILSHLLNTLSHSASLTSLSLCPQVRLDATARSITEEACQKLELKSSGNYELCEVKSSGEKVRFNDKDISIWSEISVNGRLFVLPKKHSEQVVVSTEIMHARCIHSLYHIHTHTHTHSHHSQTRTRFPYPRSQTKTVLEKWQLTSQPTTGTSSPTSSKWNISTNSLEDTNSARLSLTSTF